MAEHRSPKPRVGGSNPFWPALLNIHIHDIWSFTLFLERIATGLYRTTNLAGNEQIFLQHPAHPL